MPHTTYQLPLAERAALRVLAQARGFWSPNRPDAPNATELLRALAAGRCVALGPFMAADFGVLVTALRYAAEHVPDLDIRDEMRPTAAAILLAASETIVQEANWHEG